MKTDSEEYRKLMEKWSDEAWIEENERETDEEFERADYMGKLDKEGRYII